MEFRHFFSYKSCQFSLVVEGLDCLFYMMLIDLANWGFL